METKRPAPGRTRAVGLERRSGDSAASRRCVAAQASLDARAELGRDDDPPQLRLDCEQHVGLERELTRARGARLEVLTHERALVRCQLAVEVLVHPAKDFLAPEAIQW